MITQTNQRGTIGAGSLRLLVFFLGLTAAVAIPPESRAAILLAIDFDDSLFTTGVTEAGFQQFIVPDADTGGVITQNYGAGASAFTVKLAGDASVDGSGILNSTGTAANGLNARRRAAPTFEGGSFTYNNLYRELANGKNTGANSLALQIYGTGLEANTAYEVTFYAYDDNNTTSSTFVNLTGGANTTLGTISWTAGYAFNSSTPNSIFALTSNVTTDLNGRLTFGVGAAGLIGKIDGFQIASVPEPTTSAMLFLAGALGLIRRRDYRRRMAYD